MLNVYSQHSKTTEKKCCLVNRSTGDCQCFNHYNKTDELHKIKRWKTRKERSQISGGWREALRTESHQYSGWHQSSKDERHFHNCCHSSCYCPSRRDPQFPNFIPVAQEPSIITDSRLIGHHGLFNHEVKSIDIERLLSKQRKQEKSGKQVQDKSHALSQRFSTSDSPPFSRKDLMGAKTEVVPFGKNADDATNAHDDYLKREKKMSVGSDITPGQRPQQELDLSSGSNKSIFLSKHSSLDVVIYKSKKTNSIRSESGRESQLSQTSGRDNVKTLNKKLNTLVASNSSLEHTLKNQKPPIQQTQGRELSSSPPQLSSTPITESFDMQQKRQNPSCVSKSVSTVAARLCDCLHFPFLKRRNLVTESREVLLRALWERHGPQLQENLKKVQQSHNFGNDLSKEVQNEKPPMIDKDVLFPTDTTAFLDDTAIQPCFDSQSAKSLKITGSRYFNCSSLQPHRSLERTAEWFTSPVTTSASLLEDILRPSCSPQFFMDSWPYGASSSDHLFFPSATPCWGNTSTSQKRKDGFNRLKTNESFMSDSFKNILKNNSEVEESCGPHYTGINIQALFPYPAQLPYEHSEPTHFPHKPEQFVTDRHSYAPSLSAQIHTPILSNQFIDLSTYHPLRSHHTDMMHYPPSHMLERDPAPPFSSFLSPEHWCFPPMRLY
ncbi:hypothetical protein EXN66_Car007800 [Channa argus]|uniref:Uncharacterized protein n=2 Tax=Channa argus TaxID=215402 RepID=A0A6G1PPQ1_CHAAH|nr:hypothetical protein EXN66_Car007800 [Channa argus]